MNSATALYVYNNICPRAGARDVRKTIDATTLEGRLYEYLYTTTGRRPHTPIQKEYEYLVPCLPLPQASVDHRRKACIVVHGATCPTLPPDLVASGLELVGLSCADPRLQDESWILRQSMMCRAVVVYGPTTVPPTVMFACLSTATPIHATATTSLPPKPESSVMDWTLISKKYKSLFDALYDTVSLSAYNDRLEEAKGAQRAACKLNYMTMSQRVNAGGMVMQPIPPANFSVTSDKPTVCLPGIGDPRTHGVSMFVSITAAACVDFITSRDRSERTTPDRLEAPIGAQKQNHNSVLRVLTDDFEQRPRTVEDAVLWCAQHGAMSRGFLVHSGKLCKPLAVGRWDNSAGAMYRRVTEADARGILEMPLEKVPETSSDTSSVTAIVLAITATAVLLIFVCYVHKHVQHRDLVDSFDRVVL